mmetsp:Transcript_106616/g.229605  ORF Transcript_106616/g.229605 Transcript_106616/m.229605 type:complete len:203 (-) Transcript_106616:159-767(-)
MPQLSSKRTPKSSPPTSAAIKNVAGARTQSCTTSLCVPTTTPTCSAAAWKSAPQRRGARKWTSSSTRPSPRARRWLWSPPRMAKTTETPSRLPCATSSATESASKSIAWEKTTVGDRNSACSGSQPPCSPFSASPSATTTTARSKSSRNTSPRSSARNLSCLSCPSTRRTLTGATALLPASLTSPTVTSRSIAVDSITTNGE